MKAEKGFEIFEDKGGHFFSSGVSQEETVQRDVMETFMLNMSSLRGLSDYQPMQTNANGDASPILTPSMQQYKEYSATKTGYEHLNTE
jgi:hypothetical protein